VAALLVQSAAVFSADMHALDGEELGGGVLQVEVAANNTAAGRQGDVAGRPSVSIWANRNGLEVGGTEWQSWVEEAATETEPPESDDDIVASCARAGSGVGDEGGDLGCDCRSGEAGGGEELHDEE